MKRLFKVNSKVVALFFCFMVFLSCKQKIKKEQVKMIETSRVEHLPYYKDSSFTPHWITPNSEEEKQFHKIPDFELVNQLGDTITHDTFEGKIYITDFFFTSCPGICLKMTSNMLKLQEEFQNENNVLFLSHSVTPSIDSVAVLRKYAEKNAILDNKWHLVTGDKTEIYNLGRNQYFVENDMGIQRDINDFLHTENFLLIDNNKHIRGIYNGLNRASLAQLVIDARTLQKEL